MPKLTNVQKKVLLEINLLKNEFLDIEPSRSDSENWIPFELNLIIENERLAYESKDGATFSCLEIKNMITSIDEIIQLKSNNRNFKRYEFSTSECYFDLVFYDPFEENEVYMELWINIGALTKGQLYGYDKGYRFVVSLDGIMEFTNALRLQMKELGLL